MRRVAVGSYIVLCSMLAACGSDRKDKGLWPEDNPAPPTNPPEAPLPAGTLQFDVADLQATESQGTVNVNITRTAGSRGAVSVTLSTADGTAVAGQDYTTVNPTVTFADGDTATKTVAIPVIDDGDHESDEAFTVTLASPTGDATLGTQTVTTVTIEASDVPPPPPAAATLGMNLGLKQLKFSWPAVSGTTHYQLLSNPDGISGFTQVGSDLPASTTNTTLDIAVHRQDWANARYKLAACNVSGCSESNEIDTTGAALQTIGYFKASNTAATDQFGTALAFSADGNTLAVGVWNEDSAATGIDGDQTSNSGTSAGAVYVFTHDSTGWSQQAYVKASNTDLFDNFGYSLALSANGNTLAVSARQEQSTATGVNGDQTDNGVMNSGAVYVFTRADTTWSQQAYVKASNTADGDYFGWSLALSADGNTMAVSSYAEGSAATGINGNQADNSLPSAGAVYVFTRASSAWSQEAYVKASNTDAGDSFGSALALSADGDTLAVSAIYEDSAATGINGNQADASAGQAGAVYVFARASGAWSQQAYVKASNTQGSDFFGRALALSADGDTLAVGADGEDSSAIGIDGDETNGSASSSGAVYVFTRASSAWSQEAYVKASNTDAGDAFGSALALTADGNTLAVGATSERSVATGINGDETNDSANLAGAVYVFTRASSTWAQQSYVKAANTEPNDNFGAALALSGDGESLAVSATYEDSNATGIDGDQSNNGAVNAGAVYLY